MPPPVASAPWKVALLPAATVTAAFDVVVPPLTLLNMASVAAVTSMAPEPEFRSAWKSTAPTSASAVTVPPAVETAPAAMMSPPVEARLTSPPAVSTVFASVNAPPAAASIEPPPVLTGPFTVNNAPASRFRLPPDSDKAAERSRSFSASTEISPPPLDSAVARSRSAEPVCVYVMSPVVVSEPTVTSASTELSLANPISPTPELTASIAVAETEMGLAAVPMPSTAAKVIVPPAMAPPAEEIAPPAVTSTSLPLVTSLLTATSRKASNTMLPAPWVSSVPSIVRSRCASMSIPPAVLTAEPSRPTSVSGCVPETGFRPSMSKASTEVKVPSMRME